MVYPVIGTIGDSKKGGDIIKEFRNACGANQVIVVTGEQPHIGKSTVVETLASGLGEDGLDVLVIDADLRTHNGLSQKYGVGKELVHAENFDIRSAAIGKLRFTNVFESEEFSELVKGSRNEYDFILIDTPPLSLCNDAIKAAAVADGVVVVRPQTGEGDMNILGIIENAGVRSRRGAGRYPWTR